MPVFARRAYQRGPSRGGKLSLTKAVSFFLFLIAILSCGYLLVVLFLSLVRVFILCLCERLGIFSMPLMKYTVWLPRKVGHEGMEQWF